MESSSRLGEESVSSPENRRESGQPLKLTRDVFGRQVLPFPHYGGLGTSSTSHERSESDVGRALLCEHGSIVSMAWSPN